MQSRISHTEAFPHFKTILQHFLLFPRMLSISRASFRSGVSYVKFCYFKWPIFSMLHHWPFVEYYNKKAVDNLLYLSAFDGLVSETSLFEFKVYL